MSFALLQRRGRLFVVLVIALLLGGGVARGADQSEFPSEWFAGDVDQQAKLARVTGKDMPKLDLSDWVGEKPLMAGHVMVVYFFNTFQDSALEPIPELNRIFKKYHDK